MWANQKQFKRQTGFTIVELLIVIVVIAILAAISVVAFNGVQSRARVSAVSSALTQSSKKILLWQIESSSQGVVPDCATFAAQINSTVDSTNNCNSSKDSISYQYRQTPNNTAPTGYCITATTGTTSYNITNTTSPTSGGCAGHGQGGQNPITNLVTNPSFESATTGWSVSGGASIARSCTAAHIGSCSLSVTIPANSTSGSGANMPSGAISATPGTTYIISAYVRATAGASLVFVVDEYNGGSYVALSSTNFVASGNWDRITVSRTAASGSSIRPVIRTSSVNAGVISMDIDGVMATQGSSVYTYADGSSTNWIWNGTANNATSTGMPL